MMKMADSANIMTYSPEPTLYQFHKSSAFYRGIMGPVGSGKSTACCVEILARSRLQAPGGDGIARTRWLIARNTYPELMDTTFKTWMHWTPERYFGKFNQSTKTHHVKFEENGKKIEAEILFRPLDTLDDIGRVLSLELTGAWINEAREVPKGLVDALGDRVGRYPSKDSGGCTYRGIILDTNPPDEDHWWYGLSEETRPKNWRFFKQPGGLIERDGKFYHNPKAENLAHLDPGYYTSRVEGKSKAHVRVYYCAQYGFAINGKPVIPEYVDALHCFPDEIKPVSGLPIYIGIDFGLTPAAVFLQRLVSGRWQAIDEVVTEDMGATRFAELLRGKMNREYPGFLFDAWGDPAGEQRSQVDERTPFLILNAAGIQARACSTNDFTIRREAIARPLSRIIDGVPGLVISPKCKRLRKGLAGGYCYKRMAVSGDEKFRDMPDKNMHSHVVEACGYGLLGGGEWIMPIRNQNSIRSTGRRRATATVSRY